MLNELKELAKLRVLSTLNKKRIETISKEIGLEFTPKNSKCSNCYHDQIMIIMATLNNKKSKCKFKTKNINGYKVGDILVNNETLTNKLAFRFMKLSPAHKNLLIKITE